MFLKVRWVRSSPCLGCKAKYEVICNARRVELRDVEMKCVDREQWNEFVNDVNDGVIARS